MTKAVLILSTHAVRLKAALWCSKLPDGTRVEFRETRRSIPQNDRMWAMLTDVCNHVNANGGYHGLRLTPTDWKALFTAALRRELRQVPNLDGDGLVLLGDRTSEMSKAEMGDLMELIASWGARNGVEFSDPAYGLSGQGAAMGAGSPDQTSYATAAPQTPARAA